MVTAASADNVSCPYSQSQIWAMSLLDFPILLDNKYPLNKLSKNYVKQASPQYNIFSTNFMIMNLWVPWAGYNVIQRLHVLLDSSAEMALTPKPTLNTLRSQTDWSSTPLHLGIKYIARSNCSDFCRQAVGRWTQLDLGSFCSSIPVGSTHWH